MTDEFFISLGAWWFKKGGSLLDGPCFQYQRQTFAWQTGWMQSGAYCDGFLAGMDGKSENANPHTRNCDETTANMGLAEAWLRGFRKINS